MGLAVFTGPLTGVLYEAEIFLATSLSACLAENTLPPNGFVYQMVTINLFDKNLRNTGHVNTLH